MAVSDTRTTFLDIQQMLAPDGKGLLPVAEVLAQENALLQDGPISKSNGGLGHRVTLRTGMPTVSTGQVNRGITKSKPSTEQRTESMALFVGRSEVDLKIRKMYGAAKFNQKVASDAIAFQEKFSQYVAAQAIYGSVFGDIGTFDGLQVRTDVLQAPAPGTSGSQVWSAGSVADGDGSSLYIVDWGDRGVHWIYPEDDAAGGLSMQVYPETPVDDENGVSFFAHVTEWMWSLGLAVEDPRHLGRLCNIDISDANLGASATQGQLTEMLEDILGEMPTPGGRTQRVIYANSRLFTAFKKQARSKSNGAFTMEDFNKVLTPHFDGVPFRRVDQITRAEDTVA